MISWLAITVNLKSVLTKLMLVETVKLRTLGKAAVVVKRVARASCLWSVKPAFNQSFPFWDLLLWGSRPLNTWLWLVSQLKHWTNGPRAQSSEVGNRETSPQGPCLTKQPIKNYRPTLHVLGKGKKLHPTFLWLVSHPIIF